MDLHCFVEHGGWADPHALLTVKRLVQSHWFKRFTVPHSTQHLVKQIFVMTVVAGAGDDEGGKVSSCIKFLEGGQQWDNRAYAS